MMSQMFLGKKKKKKKQWCFKKKEKKISRVCLELSEDLTVGGGRS